MKRLPGRAIVADVKSGTLGSRVHRKNLFVLAVAALVVAGLTSVAGAAPVPALALHPARQTGVGNKAPQLPPCPADEIEDGGEPAPVQPQGPSQAAGSLAAPSFQLVPSSDTGISNSDRLTGNNMPSFEGQAPAGSTVALFADGLLVGIATADDQGNWSTMLNECQALDDGARAITAQAFDDAGQVSALSPELPVTILTTAPDMPVITPALANSHAKGGRLVVSGTAAPGTSIKVLEGRSVRARAQVDAGGAWSATVAGLAAGPHTLRARTRPMQQATSLPRSMTRS